MNVINKHTLNVDVETFSLEDITKGVHKYTTQAELLLFGYSYDKKPVKVVDVLQGEEIPDDVLNALFDKNVTKKAWNAAFEIEQMERYLFAEMNIAQWQCTMVKSARCGYPLSLGEAAKAIGLPVEKDSAGKALIKLFSVPRKPTKHNSSIRVYPADAPEKWEEFKRYCKQDVVVEMHIDDFLSQYPEQPHFENKMYVLDRQINKRGLELDIPFIEKAIQIDSEYKEILTEKAKEVTGLDNPNSVDQLKNWLEEKTGVMWPGLDKEVLKFAIEDNEVPFAERVVYEKGSAGYKTHMAKPANIKKYSKENAVLPDSVEVVEMDGSRVGFKMTPVVKEALELRKELSNTSVRKYVTMLSSQIFGRIYDTIQFNGAGRTGRNAGRLIQPQNLPRVYMSNEELDVAREIVKTGSLDTLFMCFDSVSSVLSQLIRTAIIASKGKRLEVVDLSAIEARVLAWLADEEHVLQVFRTHGKIYEATAAMMFKVPFESVTKGSEMRQRGKTASLACGYQGGVNAITTMDLDKKIPDADKPGLVKAWRDAHPNIVRYWYKTQNAAIKAIENPGEKVPLTKGAYFITCKDALLFYLPSGRYLMYPKVGLEEGQYGKKITFMGLDQTTNKWRKQDTYGGKLVENCISLKTRVITDKGIKLAEQVSTSDKLWDGLNWVSHEGLVLKGVKKVISVNGVHMTGDHKILTNEGWKNASSCQGLNRYEGGYINSSMLQRIRRDEILVDFQMRLRGYGRFCSQRIYSWGKEVVRMSKLQTWCKIQENTQYVSNPCLPGMALDARQMSFTYAPSLAQLRGSGDFSMRKLGQFVSCFLGRYGRHLQAGAHYREGRCKRELREEQLYLGYYEKTDAQQEEQQIYKNALGQNNCSRSIREIGDKRYYSFVSPQSERTLPLSVRETGSSEQVCDLINSGPLHRFTVLDENGSRMIVHNCTQAVARDILMEGMLNIVRKGYDLVTNVHDETVSEVPDGFGSTAEIEKLMCTMPAWADGLPLGAEGFSSQYYKK